MSTRSNPYVSVLLTVLAAGLGHLYLGYVRRGLLWLGVYAFTLVFLSTYSPIPGSETVSPFIISVLNTQLTAVDTVFPLAILVLCAFDVTVLARTNRSRPSNEAASRE